MTLRFSKFNRVKTGLWDAKYFLFIKGRENKKITLELFLDFCSRIDTNSFKVCFIFVMPFYFI